MGNSTLTYPTLSGQSVPKHVFLEGILALLPDYIFWKNTESIYLGCNVNFAELVQVMEPDTIVGKCDQGLPWRDTQNQPIDVFRHHDEDVLNGEFMIDRQLTLPLATGNRYIAMTKLPLVNENDQVIGLVGVFKGSGRL